MSVNLTQSAENKNIRTVEEPLNGKVFNGTPVRDNNKKYEFVTSSNMYKAKPKKKKYTGKQATRQLKFITELSKYTRCILYIEKYIRGYKLAKKYSYSNIVNELSTIHNNHKLDFIQVKLFEILLTLTVTDRTSLIFNQDQDSIILREIWINYNNVYKNYMSKWTLEDGRNIDL
jgi:hypothetical protein